MSTRTDRQKAAYRFFLSKGVQDFQAAAIVGNLDAESGMRTNAFNHAHGGTGIAQWLGGRLTNLKQFAASKGTSYEDFGTQLEFVWHELSGGERGAMRDLSRTTSLQQAAQVFFNQFERGASKYTQYHVDRAVSLTNKGTFKGLTASAASGLAGSGSDGGFDVTKPKDADYEQALGPLAGLLQAVPELKRIEDKAISGGWTEARFQQEIQQSDWYQQHSSTVRQRVALRETDPSTYKQNLTAAERQVQRMADHLGAPLTDANRSLIANVGLNQNLMGNSDWLQQAVATHTKLADVTGGQLYNTAQQVKTLGLQYGYQYTDDYAMRAAQGIVRGRTTLDTYRQNLVDWAAKTYREFAPQIKDGLTVEDLAQPYIQDAAQTLELNPQDLTTRSKVIRDAMMGRGDMDGTANPMTMTQFDKYLRQDPRWQYTTGAKQTVLSALHQIGSDWGYSS